MTQTMQAPMEVNYTVLITQLKTDQPGLAEPSFPFKACRRLISLGNTSHEKSGGERGMPGITSKIAIILPPNKP